MMEKISAFVFLLAVTCVFAQETPVQQCGPEKLFKKVVLTTREGICTKLPCKLKLGENIRADIEFQNKEKVETITSKCFAKVGSNEIEFPIPDASNGCNKLVNTQCPIPPKTDVHMRVELPVKPPSVLQLNTVPDLQQIGIDVKLTFSLNDQRNQTISCFALTAKVFLT